jgi:hypothetical protein
MLVSPSSSSRRPPFFILAIAVISAVLAFHTLYYGFYDTSSILSYTGSTLGRVPWLILTMSDAKHIQRRHIIRKTWQSLYRESGAGFFDTRFVIADPGPFWHDLIEQENATYGDLIMLHHEHESWEWAHTVKPMEALTHVVAQGKPYIFVSKMDEDSWLDAKTFYKVWLKPRIRSDEADGLYIGRKLQHDYPFKYASGQFYTLSWDVVTHLVDFWADNPINDEHEDVLIARLLYEAGVQYNLTVLPLRASFVYEEGQGRGDGTAFAHPLQFVDDNLYHGISAGSVNPGQLQDDETYLQVTACYDEDGVMATEKISWDKYMEVDAGW